MITKDKMLPMLVEACPSFANKLHEHRDFFEEEITYTELGVFANHLVDLHKQNKTDEFLNIFDVIEKLHIEGDEFVKEAATIGLLEGLQNIAGNQDLNPEIFFKYLKPVSVMRWNELNKFWNGESQFVG
jgi:hypothetical protein